MLRLLLWLMIALVPLQGFAAAARLCCAMQHHPPGPSIVQPQQPAAHAKLTPAPMNMAAASPQATTGFPAMANSPDACGVCASLCHALAIPQSGRCDINGEMPREFLSHLLFALSSRALPVADKPPRA